MAKLARCNALYSIKAQGTLAKLRKRSQNRTFFLNESNFLMKNDYLSEWQMRMATSVHHTNPRSATLDFWRKTTRFEDYKLIQAKRRAQMNRPTR